MKPSIGRIVIYKYSESEKCQHTNGATEVPAVIVRVWSDACVNLKLIEDGPQDSWRTSRLLYTGPESGDGSGQWRWPERV